MLATGWKPVLMDIDRATEFTGDDVDQYSKLCDLGNNFEFLTVIIPTITSSTISIAGQMTKEVDEVPVVINILDDDATGHFAHATTAGTAGMIITFRLGGLQYFRIKAGSNQAADRTFYCRGFNRN